MRRYRVNIIRNLPEISLQCQPEIRQLQRRLKAAQIMRGLVHTACTNDRDIITLFVLVVIP